MSESKKKMGFASLSPERLREIASSGGVARKKAFDQARTQRGTTLQSRPPANSQPPSTPSAA